MKFLIALLLALTLPFPANHTLAADKVFTLNNTDEPESIDPGLASGVIEETILFALFEGLINYHPETSEAMPGVAKRWDISKDGKTYTFHLRDNARWHNGDPVTAHDFVYAWKRVLDPKTASTLAYHLYYIRGAKEFKSGELKDFSKVGVRAVDDHTFEVKLLQPTPYFLFLCGLYTFYPVHKPTIEKHGSKWTRVENIVSNGPFKLKLWRQHDRIVVEKFPGYWNVRNVHLDKVILYPLTNKDTVLNLYKSGKLDYTGRFALPEARVEQLKQRSDFHAPAILAVDFFRINTTQPPFDTVEVRQALSLAIDRKLLVEKVTKTGEVPTSSISPSMPGYSPAKGHEFNPKKAAQLLSRAGFCTPKRKKKGCKPFPKFELHYNTNNRHKLNLLAVQQMWKQHLGIENVALLNREWKVYLKDHRALNYTVTRSGWIADYNDPLAFVEMFVTGGVQNQTGWANPKFDEFIAKINEEADSKKRLQLIHKAESLLLKEAPVIPLYVYSQPYLLQPRIIGFYGNATDKHPFQGIDIKDKI